MIYNFIFSAELYESSDVWKIQILIRVSLCINIELISYQLDTITNEHNFIHITCAYVCIAWQLWCTYWCEWIEINNISVLSFHFHILYILLLFNFSIVQLFFIVASIGVFRICICVHSFWFDIFIYVHLISLYFYFLSFVGNRFFCTNLLLFFRYFICRISRSCMQIAYARVCMI